MKKILGIIVLSLLLSTSAFSVNKNVGTGDVTLSDDSVYYFMQYLKGGSGKKPGTFWITIDGTGSTYWYCNVGSCESRGEELAQCEQYYNKECKLFARRRTIKWHNGINTGKGKESTFKSKWSGTKVKAKLTELGFLGGSTSSSTTTTPKITKKKKPKITKKKKEPKITKKNTEDKDIVNKIKDLKELFDSGVLTQEEFTKAKKKLLN